MAEWLKTSLIDIMDLIGGGTPKTSKAEYWGGNINWLSVKDFNNEIRYVYSTEKTITAEGLNNSSTKLLKKDDIIISARGTVGELAMIPFPMAFNQSCYGIRAKDGIDKTFLYYLLKYSVRKLKVMTHGSVFDTITRDTFANIDVAIPDIETQHRVAKLFADIDDKVENNQRINKNLEQQALAIFRQYFMDFAPYGGVAPSDWMEVSLDDVCIRITDGSHYSPADSPDSPYPMYSVKDMETYGFNSSTCKHITEDEFRKMKKSDCVPLLNDILVAKDGSYLKEIFICSEEKEEAILSSIAIFRPNTSVIMPEILLYFLKQPSVRKDVGDNYVSGSALPRIVLKDFKKYRLTLPTMNEQLKIGSVLHAIRMQTKANIDEIQRLSSIRDTLLPQLMSGNLDVSALDI